MSGILPIILLGILVSIISSVTKQAKKAREDAARRNAGPSVRKVVSMDDQLRQQIRQRVDTWQPSAVAQPAAQAQATEEGVSGYDARWPIAPLVSPEQPQVRLSYAAETPQVAVQDDAGGPDDRAVTRRVMTPRYTAEDAHNKARAPHLQDDERGYDSFTGAATFRRATARAQSEQVDISPLLRTPVAMANAVILTEVLHHRGGRSAKWSR